MYMMTYDSSSIKVLMSVKVIIYDISFRDLRSSLKDFEGSEISCSFSTDDAFDNIRYNIW